MWPMHGGPGHGLSVTRYASGSNATLVISTASPEGIVSPEVDRIQFTRTHWAPPVPVAPSLWPPIGSEATEMPGLPPLTGNGCSTAVVFSVEGAPVARAVADLG